ncbi:MAG: endonuclease/exonuclease/phosphatase family protein, partial [Thiomargarita sp.]|nr:endonuclease/exonuclease/phosphatase family protein [Thiomargarita sp.]
MTRIITLNANGIRAAARKGFFTWLDKQNADIICIQETRAQETQLTDPQFHPPGYYCYYHDAEKKGYSGVALYSRFEPKKVIKGIGWQEVDCEGRYLEIQLPQFNIISLYMHSGSSSEERQTKKFD